jgi:phosphonate transport system substrate-binding protein
LWIDTILGESGLGCANDFFGSTGDGAKPASVVLPVFFGESDAAVVNRSSLETMQELNPQLATQLQVLTNSPFLPESVICLRKNYTEAREDVLRSLAQLHTQSRGQQILLIFSINKLVPFEPGQLESLRDLSVRYERVRQPTTGPRASVVSAGKPKS